MTYQSGMVSRLADLADDADDAVRRDAVDGAGLGGDEDEDRDGDADVSLPSAQGRHSFLGMPSAPLIPHFTTEYTELCTLE